MTSRLLARCQEDGRVLGWCDVLSGTSSAGAAQVGHLGMGVLRARRSQGIGRRLPEAKVSRARELGLEKIELSVYASIPARFVDGIYDDVLLVALELRMPSQHPSTTDQAGSGDGEASDDSCRRREAPFPASS
jgi:GNAT superfamily N-acetyltransferase